METRFMCRDMLLTLEMAVFICFCYLERRHGSVSGAYIVGRLAWYILKAKIYF